MSIQKKIVSYVKLGIYYILGNRRSVVAALMEKDGMFLIARRKPLSRLGGKWEFPGGKLEPGETPEECLRRELKEELDIDARIGEFFCKTTFIYAYISIELLVYRAYHIGGEFLLNEHDQMQWVRPDQFVMYDFVEADKPVIQKILKEFS